MAAKTSARTCSDDNKPHRHIHTDSTTPAHKRSDAFVAGGGVDVAAVAA